MKNSATPERLFFELVLIIAVAELLVMGILPMLGGYTESQVDPFMDVGLLVLLAGPAMYWRCQFSFARWRRAAANPGQSGRTFSFRVAAAITAVTQLLGLVCTAALVLWLKQDLDREMQQSFDHSVQRMESQVRYRFDQALLRLRSASGIYAANGNITRKGFEAYTESRDVLSPLDGVRGLGWVTRVKRENLDSFLAQQREENAPDFQVVSKGGDADLYVVKYIEPYHENHSLRGYDLAQDAAGREAAERAMKTGNAALSARTAVGAGEDGSIAMAYLLPVFRNGTDPVTSDQYRAAHVGWVYTTVEPKRLLSTVATTVNEGLRLELYDGFNVGKDSLLYDSMPAVGALAGAYQTTLPIVLGGRALTLKFTSTARFHADQDRSSLKLAALVGGLASLLAALAVWLLVVGRLRAQRLAERMTVDLDRLARVVKRTNSAVAIADADMRITWVNEGFVQLTGNAFEEVEGKIALEAFATGTASPTALRQWDDAVQQQKSCRIELPHRAKDGRDYWVDAEVQPTHDVKGAFTGFMVIATDVTAQKRTQERLEAAIRDSSALLSAVQSHTIVSVGNRDGTITEVNDAFCTISGYTRAELIGQNHRIAQSSVHSNAFWADMWVTISQGHSWRGEICNRAKDGSLYWVDSMIAPFMGADGEVEKYVSIRTDITARKLAEIQVKDALVRAEQASVAKSQFVANMSHEIRTPMNAILGMLKLVQQTELNARQRDYASKADGAARSLLGLLNDILDFSKVEAGKMTLDPHPFRMDRVLRDLSVILSASVGKKSVEVLFDIDPALPRSLVGDDMRLGQVLINLGGNAIKFTTQGEVVLRIKVVEQTEQDVLIEFSVKDSGIGIAPENQKHIFSGFSQAESSTTRRFGGTGLGLAISSRLVALLGGQLQLDSVLGQGSTFYFQLRFALDLAARAGEGLACVEWESRAQRVLVVDDNPIARQVLQAMVASLGWQVDLAEGGVQALQMIELTHAPGQTPYDLILMDWQMPEMDGWEASQRIREAVDGSSAPIVVMVTANGREMLAQRSAAEQALLNGFLVKPVTASMLFDSVMEARSVAGGRPLIAAPAVHLTKRLQGLRLLVVEDNKVNQIVAQGLLTQEGASVTLADNGELGVAAIAAAPTGFDVVLMDIQMPVMDGYEATRAIRNTLRLPNLPVIAMTANAMASDKVACLEAGMNEHDGKPFDLDHLVSVLLRFGGTRPSAPVASAAQATPLASGESVEDTLPELDTQDALARMGGNSALMTSVLQSFAADLKNLPMEVQHHLAVGDTKAALRSLHTLKGLAATVGAKALAKVAAQLESALKNGMPEAEFPALIAQLRQSIEATQVALEPLLEPIAFPQPGEETDTQGDYNQAQFREDVQELCRLLKAFDMVALTAHQSMKSTYGKAPGAQAMTKLQTAMDALDFAAALEVCQHLLER